MDSDIIEVDLNEVERFINEQSFHSYLVNNTTDFGVAAFILQILLDKVEELKNSQVDNT